jgi:hypothetical protein
VVAPFWRWSNGKRNVVSIKGADQLTTTKTLLFFSQTKVWGTPPGERGWPPPWGMGIKKRVIKKVLIKFDIIKLEVRINEILI